MSEKKARIINLGLQPEKPSNIIPLNSQAHVVDKHLLIPYRKNTKWGFCTPDKKLVFPCIYEQAGAFSEGLAAVAQHEKSGYIDATGKMAIPYKFDFGGSFKEGVAVINIGSKYGYIDKTGNVVIKAEYNYATDFEDGLAMVELKGKIGFIDKKGTRVIPCKYDEVTSFKNGISYVALGGKDLFIDKTGKEVPEPEEGFFFDGFAVDYSDDEEGFGFISENDEMLTPYIFEEAHDFSEGMAAVCMNEKWGFIDTTGALIVPCIYDDVIFDFDNGLALIEIDDDFGYIDRKGTEYFE